MAIAPLRLDDLAWPDMVESIRRRIPAVSAGRWTLHAPVDPGMTLLELFAALLEQRVYWLDQTPEPLVRGVLALLGEKPRPAVAASTVLAFAGASFTEVAAGARMELAGRMPRLVFTTADALTLLPVREPRLEIGGRDRTLDLVHGRLLRLFPADRSPALARVILRLSQPLPAVLPAAPLSLLVELDAPAGIAPAWDEAAAGAPPPATVFWEYPAAGAGSPRPFGWVEDGTGGLRRSGVVRLAIPPDWQAEAGSQPGTFDYAVHLRVEKATFSAPPRLAALTPNAVVAHHRRPAGPHPLTLSWLPLPGQTISLAELPPAKPEKDHPPLVETVRLRLQERDHGWQEWSPTADLAFHGPDDRVFVVDRELGVLRFGDGLTGRQPVLAGGGNNGEVEYEVGGGPAGDLGARLGWQGDGGLAAVNPVPAAGGAEAQTLTAAREEVAAALRRPTRAVLRQDYEELARTTPGVAIRRARAAVGLHPAYPCRKVAGAVTVFLVPDVPREEEDEETRESAFIAAPLPDPGALEAVRARLDAARLVGSEVFVAAPRYRGVSLVVRAQADAPDPAALERRLADHLRRFLDPLTGGDDGTGWPFGEPLRPSVLLRETQKALGSDGEISRVSIGLDGAVPGEDCKDVAIGEHELVYLADLGLEIRSGAPLRGGLR
jgi:hypothetical protein